MNFEIKKIRLNELEHFVQSEMFRQFTIIPISELRVKSYIHNPHSKPDDVALYIGFVQNQLVAFRTLFADRINSEKGNTRFAWCSGNWVHPDFRRNGFSEQLLNEAFIDWDGKLMFTNYAPNSEKLYLKSGKFQSIHQFEGFRGYFFPKTRKLLPFTNKNLITKLLFSIADIAISSFTLVRLMFYSVEQNPDFRFEILQYPDEDCYKMIENQTSKYLFNHGEKILKWIFQFPWISFDNNFNSIKYPFSSYSKFFSYKTIKVFNQNNLVGFFIFSIREGHLKTVYFNLPNGIETEISAFLKQFCAKHKIELVTVYKKELAKQLSLQKFPFLHAKKYGQKIYCSFDLKNIGIYRFQDGDGDVIFT